MAGPSVDDLRQVPLFAELSRRDLGRLRASLSRRTFPAGATVAEEGEVGVGFFVIEHGHARVTVDGRPVTRLGPGDHFGEIALIVETPRTATVTAETDLVCHGMTSWDFRRLVETNATISWRVLETTARRLVAGERAARDRPPGPSPPER